MTSFPWLNALIIAPVVAAAVVWLVTKFAPKYAKHTAFVLSLIVFVGSIAAAYAYNSDAASASGEKLVRVYSWIPQFGISWAVGVNGIGLLMILLSTLLVSVVLLAAWKEQKDDAKAGHYAVLVLLLEAFMMIIFAARDLFLFYMAFEAMLIPVYFLIGSYGGAKRKAASLKFLLYSLAGGLIMLLGLIGLYIYAGGGSRVFLLDNLAHGSMAGMPQNTARLIFVAFFIAFAIKAPMFPLHTWLPDAAEAAKPGTSVLLVGVLDKVGTFGMLTICLPLFPEAAHWAAPLVMTFAVVSILYGAIMAAIQKDIMRLIAYTSVSHFGFIVLGIFAFRQTSTIGSAFYMVNHGLSTGALFLAAGFIVARRGTQKIDEFGPGLQRTWPKLAGIFLTLGLAACALPGLSPFISEFLVLVGSFHANRLLVVLATIGVILAAVYSLLTYQRIFTGAPRDDLKDTKDLVPRELTVLGVLVALMLFLGFYPAPALNTLKPATQQSAQLVGVNHAPGVDASAQGGGNR